MMDARRVADIAVRCCPPPPCRQHSAVPLPPTWPLKDARRIVRILAGPIMVPGPDRCPLDPAGVW